MRLGSIDTTVEGWGPFPGREVHGVVSFVVGDGTGRGEWYSGLEGFQSGDGSLRV